MSFTDAFDVRRVLEAQGLLATFNDAGVLGAADVHVASRLVGHGLGGAETVALAAALAVRAPRLGHVYVDLATIAATAIVDADEPVDVAALPWPEAGAWEAAVQASPLVATGEADGPDGPDGCPLRLVGTRLYLDRYWREERQIAADLVGLTAAAPGRIDDELLGAGVSRLFRGQAGGRQALAAAAAVAARLAVIAGGPGTGKTTTVARILALLLEQAQAADRPVPLVGLAAPTGKASARLQEAVHQEAAGLDVSEAVRRQLLDLEAVTLHRLLGWRPDSRSRFRHDRANRLPHDVVVVDETSMVSLSMMARLAEAVRRDGRLVLVGDPGQLTSIEAGAVLGDVVGPAMDEPRMGPAARSRLSAVLGRDVPGTPAAPGVALGDGVVVLDRVHRYGGAIAAVAEAVRRGDPDATIAALLAGGDDVRWIAHDAADPAGQGALAPVREDAVVAGRAVLDAAQAGDAEGALHALGAFRVLCAHRRGDHGVSAWTARIESWLAAGIDGFSAGGRWYPGRPLLVTENDHELRLYNGDTGVVVATGSRPRAAFERRGEVVTVSPARLEAVETLHAMTIHKSQGSQVGTAVVVLPDPSSRVLTRELLYTAVTRAQDRLVVVGPEETIRGAVQRPVARASALRERLWGC